MLKPPDPAPQPQTMLPPPSALTLWLCGVAGAWLMYFAVFLQVPQASLGDAAINALANVAPLALLAAGAHLLIKRHVMRLSVPAQIISHVLIGSAFAATWFALVTLTLALVSYAQRGQFDLSGFTGGAFIWQNLQGLVLYWALAATTYAVRGGRSAAPVTIVSAPPLERYLTRKGDDIAPVHVRDIIVIAGAQDYAEVTTLTDTHLVRMSLSEFEQRLDPQRFIRVHRSRIINIDHLDYAEPSGSGRLIAHMTDGTTVPLSRTGSQSLRALIV